MAKAKKRGKGKTSKSASDKALAEGAAEIKKAQSEQDKEPIVLPKLTRSIQEIMADRVKIAPGHIGMTLDDKTPMEEQMAILDHTLTLSDHVGFMIGDILNFGEVTWGDKYKRLLQQTGKALSTLRGYSEASRRIPLEKRVAALSFSHHREILRLDDKKMEKVLEDLEKEAEKKDGYIPTRDELRKKIEKLGPTKRKSSGRGIRKRAISGRHSKKKGGKKAPELPPYTPTDAENEALQGAEIAIEETAKLLKLDGKVHKVVVQLDNKEKQRWLGMLDPIVLFYNSVNIKTGTY